MSETRDILSGVVAERETFTQERCRNLRTSRVFLAEYEEITRLDLITDLGDDPREAARIYVSDRAAIAELDDQERITVNLFGVDQKFAVIDREQNPGNPQVMFKLKYIAPSKDT